jgi:hypothetical protein
VLFELLGLYGHLSYWVARLIGLHTIEAEIESATHTLEADFIDAGRTLR